MRITERQLRKKIRYILERGAASAMSGLGAAAPSTGGRLKTTLMGIARTAATDAVSNITIGAILEDEEDEKTLQEDEPELEEKLVRDFIHLLVGPKR
tara:strand:+ start:755 stop:1045 length:291 start_codon:yes stop_codon:yes gene_type:complete